MLSRSSCHSLYPNRIQSSLSHVSKASTSGKRVFPLSATDDNTSNYDVALIHLRKSLKLDSTMQPICYPQSDDVLGTSISSCDQKAYGWGVLQATDEGPTAILQKLSVQVTPDTSECTDYVDGRIICVKGVPPTSGICFVSGIYSTFPSYMIPHAPEFFSCGLSLL